jgi:hypothetical protein
VSKSHGIDTSKYTIVADETAKPRIQAGSKTLDAVTFLTQVMHLDYRTEAAPILKQCYAEQLAKVYSQPRHEPGQVIDQGIQREFSEHLKNRDAQFKTAHQAIDEQKRQAKAVIEKSEASEAVKAERQAALTTQVKSSKKALQAEHDKLNAEIYKDFLADKSPQSAKHLDELARVSLTPTDKARLAAIQIAQGITLGLGNTQTLPHQDVLRAGTSETSSERDISKKTENIGIGNPSEATNSKTANEAGPAPTPEERELRIQTTEPDLQSEVKNSKKMRIELIKALLDNNPTAKIEDVDTNSSSFYGKIVFVSRHGFIQSIGKNRFVIHDNQPPDNSNIGDNVTVRYKSGVYTAIVKVKKSPGLE